MKVLALDISSSAGYAILEKSEKDLPNLLSFGTVAIGKTVFEISPNYPNNYYQASMMMGQKLLALVTSFNPDVIIVEQTVKGRNRWSQRYLEWMNLAFLDKLTKQYPEYTKDRLFYIDPSQWRKVLGVGLTKDEKKANAKLSKAKSAAAKNGKKLDKKALGIKGRVTKKHAAIKWANEAYTLSLIAKDDDIADAIGLGTSYFKGAICCNGK